MFQIPERKKNDVIPGVDYMDVVGRATQEAKAENRYPVKKSALQAVHLQLDSHIHGNDYYQDIDLLEIRN